MARTAKKKIALYDGGVLLSDDIDGLDFAGAGVTTSIESLNPFVVKETIPGGGATNTYVYGETVSFTGTSGTLTHTPVAGTLSLYRGGARQQLGGGNDYTISGATITLAVAASVGEIFLADYQY